MEDKKIVVNVLVQKPVQQVWESWTLAEHIRQWNIPFSGWHCPEVMIDLREGGSFCYKMATKDGKEGFDHRGSYNKIIPLQLMEYTLNDGRKSSIEFQHIDQNTIVRESFEPEKRVPEEVQRDFCQSVLERFKNYTEQQ